MSSMNVCSCFSVSEPGRLEVHKLSCLWENPKGKCPTVSFRGVQTKKVEWSSPSPSPFKAILTKSFPVWLHQNKNLTSSFSKLCHKSIKTFSQTVWITLFPCEIIFLHLLSSSTLILKRKKRRVQILFTETHTFILFLLVMHQSQFSGRSQITHL